MGLRLEVRKSRGDRKPVPGMEYSVFLYSASELKQNENSKAIAEFYIIRNTMRLRFDVHRAVNENPYRFKRIDKYTVEIYEGQVLLGQVQASPVDRAHYAKYFYCLNIEVEGSVFFMRSKLVKADLTLLQKNRIVNYEFN